MDYDLQQKSSLTLLIIFMLNHYSVRHEVCYFILLHILCIFVPKLCLINKTFQVEIRLIERTKN